MAAAGLENPKIYRIGFNTAASAIAHSLSQLRDHISEHSPDILRKTRTLPALAILALAAVGCAGMDTSTINQYQAQIAGLPEGAAVPIGAAGTNLNFSLTHATDAAVAQAVSAGVSDADINFQLAKVDRQITASAQGAIAAQLTCREYDRSHSQCDVRIQPRGDGQGMVVVSERECIRGTDLCAQPTQKVVYVDSHISPPVLNMAFQPSPDGSMTVVASAQDPAGIPGDRLKMTSCDKSATYPLSGTTARAVATIKMQPGKNCVKFWGADSRGNASEITGEYPYEFSIAITTPPVLTPEGKVKVSGSVANNTFRIPRVTIDNCGMVRPGILSARDVDVKPDGTFEGEISPSPGHNTCFEAVASDSQGARVVSKTGSAIEYQLSPGTITPIQDRNDIKTWYLNGFTAPNIDVGKVSATGSQPKWQEFGAIGTFQCDRLPDGTKTNGDTYQYVLRCQLPSTAGKVTMQITLIDKNGYSFNVPYDIPMPENPSARELFDYWWQAGLTGLALAVTSMAGAEYVKRSVRRSNAIKLVNAAIARNDLAAGANVITGSKVGPDLKERLTTSLVDTAIQNGDFAGAADCISRAKVGKELEAALREKVTLAECAAREKSMYETLVMQQATSTVPGRAERNWIVGIDQLRYLMGQEKFTRDPVVAELLFTQLQRWTETNFFPSERPDTWEDMAAGFLNANRERRIVLNSMARILTQKEYEGVYNAIVAYDRSQAERNISHRSGTLLEQMEEAVLMYELSRSHLFKEDMIGPLVAEGMGFRRATVILWKWGRFDVVKGQLAQAAQDHGQPGIINETIAHMY